MVLPRQAGSGTIRGLAAMLNRVVQRPFNLGSDLWDAMVHLTAVLPDYLVYGYLIYSEGPSVPAGSNQLVILATVPEDERWRIWAIRAERQSGDNLMSHIRVAYPAAYQTGTLVYMTLTGNAEAADTLQLPRGTGTHTVSQLGFLLEPGSDIRIFTNGTGAAASVFSATILADITKITRVAGQEA